MYIAMTEKYRPIPRNYKSSIMYSIGCIIYNYKQTDFTFWFIFIVNIHNFIRLITMAWIKWICTHQNKICFL